MSAATYSFRRLIRIIDGLGEMHAKAAAHPKMIRGKVWCRRCGAEKLVNAAKCLVDGWPVCCGHTMTIDSPVERAAHAPYRP